MQAAAVRPYTSDPYWRRRARQSRSGRIRSSDRRSTGRPGKTRRYSRRRVLPVIERGFSPGRSIGYAQIRGPSSRAIEQQPAAIPRNIRRRNPESRPQWQRPMMRVSSPFRRQSAPCRCRRCCRGSSEKRWHGRPASRQETLPVRDRWSAGCARPPGAFDDPDIAVAAGAP